MLRIWTQVSQLRGRCFTKWVSVEPEETIFFNFPSFVRLRKELSAKWMLGNHCATDFYLQFPIRHFLCVSSAPLDLWVQAQLWLFLIRDVKSISLTKSHIRALTARRLHIWRAWHLLSQWVPSTKQWMSPRDHRSFGQAITWDQKKNA